MNKGKKIAVFCAGICLSALMTGCTGTRTDSAPAQSAAETEEMPATDMPQTEAAPAETVPEQAEPEAPVTEAAAPVPETVPATTALPREDGDTKILWSERGLDARQVNDENGYGTELKFGESYLEWTLDGFNGQLDDSAANVVAMDADFSYNGTLAVNGIVTVLPSSDPDNPNMLYLRVDNQGDFPHFVQDYRERGKYIIENSRDVFPMLGLEDPPVETQYEVAVSVSVSKLHIHMRDGGYDTIRVSAASKR